jgi:hypothetical protein
MSSIQFNSKNLDPYLQDICRDFDQIKAYEVTHVDGVYTIKRIKSDVSLDTLKKMTTMILEGRVWLKEGNKKEGRRFVGKHIPAEEIKRIIVDKSDSKDGPRLDGEIAVDMVDFGEITDAQLQRVRDISEGLKKVFEKSMAQHVSPVALKTAAIREVVSKPKQQVAPKKPAIKRHANDYTAHVKEQTKKTAVRKSKKKRRQEEIAEERKTTHDEILKEAMKSDDKHQAILKEEIKRKRP